MSRNAMTDADKLLRRAELIRAAYDLFHQSGTLPSVADIAQNAGLAKGTVYLYFKTKEEIFIALLEDVFTKLLNHIPSLINQLPNEHPQAATAFSAQYCQIIRQMPDLLPLASTSNAILEQNLPIESMVRFKLFLASSLQEYGLLVEKKFPSLARGEGAGLLLRTYSLTLGLWQSLNYPTALVEALSPDVVKILKRDFDYELNLAIRQMWIGCLR